MSVEEFLPHVEALHREEVPSEEVVRLARKWFEVAEAILDERDSLSRWRFIKRGRLANQAMVYCDAFFAVALYFPEVVDRG